LDMTRYDTLPRLSLGHRAAAARRSSATTRARPAAARSWTVERRTVKEGAKGRIDRRGTMKRRVGWFFAAWGRVEHYMENGESLCGRVSYAPAMIASDLEPDVPSDRFECCAKCAEALDRRRRRKRRAYAARRRALRLRAAPSP